ncbi:hypothetical protein FB45DRAFT_1035435 [Roridomyces roridus]|uniref:MYND-type domain-containing protein n=1 Tax=Roridomyces roridus TaxID=1738132 RepID=A0AAD7BAK7_9AGAR|nr:hypothetical protein FB45DRAFT_1035435 [Roridomyces roridus]
MHPCLRPSSLQLLPTAYRKTAYAALNGSRNDLATLLEYGSLRNQSINRLFLPAFYAHLGHAAAEQIAAREILEDAEPVILAYMAVRGFIMIEKIPREAQLEIWPGLWKWCQVILQHDYCLPGRGFQQYRISEVHILIIGVIDALRVHWETMADNFNTEPELRILVGRVWALLARKDHWRPGLQTAGFGSVGNLLVHGLVVTNRQHTEDLIEGCGGSLADLVQVAVKSITHMRGESKEHSVWFLVNSLSAIERTHQQLLRPDSLLLQGGLVRALVTKLCQIGPVVIPGEYCLDRPWTMLLVVILQSPHPIWVVEALDAGLLRLVVSALENPQMLSAADLELVFPHLLIPFCPYYSVSSRIRSWLESGEIDLDKAEHSPVWGVWKDFVTNFNDIILPVLNAHESSERIATLGCDNVECNIVSLKRDFRRCSGCESVNYCSVSCQEVDWCRGHRNNCSAIQLHSIEHPDLLTTRDGSFLRTFMDTTYATNLTGILLGELLNVHLGPESQSITLFKFTEGRIQVQSVVREDPELRPLLESLGPVAEDRFSRAGQRAAVGCISMVSYFTMAARGRLDF